VTKGTSAKFKAFDSLAGLRAIKNFYRQVESNIMQFDQAYGDENRPTFITSK